MRGKSVLLAAAFAAVSISSSANAVVITGQMLIQGKQPNYFDPNNGFVPPGFGNDSGTSVTVGPGVEFGFSDGLNTDTADFTATSLSLQDLSAGGSIDIVYSFASDTPGFFSNAQLISNSLGGSFTVNGDTLTYSAPEFLVPGAYSANFTFDGGSTVSAVPEATTWAMMLVGFGGLGCLAFRRSSRKDAGSKLIAV